MQHKCIDVSFFVQNALLKGSYLYANVDLNPLFFSVNAISLLFDRISWKLFASYAKMIVLNYDIYMYICIYIYIYIYKISVTFKKK